MNLVDAGIVLFCILAAVHGLSQGAAVQVLSFGGLWGGLALGAAVGPRFSTLAQTPFGKALISLVALFGLAAIFGIIGRQIGTHAWGVLRQLRLGGADAALGGVIAVVATLVAVWLFAITLASGPARDVSAAIQGSAISRFLTDHLPSAPSVFSRLRQFIDASGFPQVFSEIEPTPAPPVALPADPTVRAAVAAAGAATVRIEGLGCGGIQEGSGFVAAPGIVVTNAHVVAGIRSPVVEDRRGRHPATPVMFDPRTDVAVLRTTGLGAGPLPMLPARVRRGDGGAVMGYPGGGPFQAGPGAVLREFQAVGRDIYGQSLTSRDVYQLQAVVRPGNSGGPFVRANGEVIGVVFAASSTESNVGYALTSAEVQPLVAQAQRQGSVGTGPCAE